MNRELDLFFDDLKRKLDFLTKNCDIDNESMRHDKLVMPILTNRFGLGWDHLEIHSQQSLRIQEGRSDCSIEKIRRPDLIIVPSDIGKKEIVIEEKAGQKDIDNLEKFKDQLGKYKAGIGCVWGLLTDGSIWLIKRDDENYMEIESLDDLRRRIRDFQHILSREFFLYRYFETNTTDIMEVLIYPDSSKINELIRDYRIMMDVIEVGNEIDILEIDLSEDDL